MPKKEQSKNMSRLNEDMKRELIFIIGEMKDPRVKSGLLTVTRVEVTNDLAQCKVFISVLGNEEGDTAEVVKALSAAKGHVRSEVASRMKIRRAPEMLFVADDSAAYAAHINEVLKGL